MRKGLILIILILLCFLTGCVEIVDSGEIVFDEKIEVKLPVEVEEIIQEPEVEEIVNHCPELQDVEDVSLDKGSKLNIVAFAIDQDGDDLTYEFNNIPNGASVDGKNMEWTLFEESCEEIDVEIEVTDGLCGDEISFTISTECPEVVDYTTSNTYCETNSDCYFKNNGDNEVEACRNYYYETYVLYDEYEYDCECVTNECVLVKEEKCPIYYLLVDESVDYNGYRVTLDEAGASSVVVSVDGTNVIINSGDTQEVNGVYVTVIGTWAGPERCESSAELGFDERCDELY